jgi:transcriptional regulator GlxA family with amidase domain
MACMNKEAFSKYFKKINGINISRYICHKRIAKAIDLIETTELTILDIAMQCGFDSMANFYKSFRLLTGKVPSVLRSQKNI